QEIAAASQEQMAAIREINVGVSQLEEVVQQNAAASHELAATSTDLASQSSGLQQKVEFFRLESSANGFTGAAPLPPRPPVTRPQARPQALGGKKLPAPRPATSFQPDGQAGHQAPNSHGPVPSTMPPQVPGPAPSPPSPPSGTQPPRGGVVV